MQKHDQYGKITKSFVPCGACELQFRQISIGSVGKKSFVPCGACELQFRGLEAVVKIEVSSPVGRVSCNSFDVITINTSIVVSSPVGRVSCNAFRTIKRFVH